MRTIYDPILGALRAEFGSTSSVGAITYFIGGYDASGGAYPSTGGTGSGGTIQKGNLWNITVAGTLPTGVVVEVGDTLLSLVDNPGQTQANWLVNQTNIGYVPENIANKSSSYTLSSTTTYANTKALVDGLATKKSIATGNAYKFETTDASGNLQETTVTGSSMVATDPNGLPTAAVSGTDIKTINGSSILGSGNLTIGGLTNWTEAVNTSAPNATVPVVSLTATNAATNVDAAFVAKGSGASLAQIPNNSTSGGNKRGAYATDWAKSRSVNSQVASGDYSTITGGLDNTASGNYSTTGGYNCTSSGTASTAFGVSSNASGSRAVAIGGSNTSSGTSSVALGQENNISGDQAVGMGYQNVGAGQYGFSVGVGNIASGYAAQAMGSGNTSSGTFSCVHGANGNAYSTRYRYVHATGAIQSQMSRFILVAATTTNSAIPLTTDSSGVANPSNIINLQNNSIYSFSGTIIAKIQTGNHGVWTIDGVISRGANAASTTLVISNITLQSNTGSIPTPTLAADTTNGGLLVNITGITSTNINFTSIIQTIEIVY